MKNKHSLKLALAFLVTAVLLVSVMMVTALADDTATASTQAELYSAITGAPAGATRTITLTDDIVVTDVASDHKYTVPANAHVIITAESAQTITFDRGTGSEWSLFYVTNNGSTLELTGPVTLACAGSAVNMYGVRAQNSSTVILGAGVTIDGFKYGGLRCESGTTLVVTGGTIQNSGRTCGGNGGGIDARGTVTITGGTIQDCSAKYGGGLALIGATLTAPITDLRIEGCSSGAGGSGGGIYIEGTCNAAFGSGTIVTGCTSATYAGGISRGSNATTGLTIDGATITGNTAATYGGGICVYSTSEKATAFIMNSGTISDNTATSGGGGGISFAGDYGRAEFNGGTVTDNSAGGDGGAVNFKGTACSITGGDFSGNTASGAGNDIFIGYSSNRTAGTTANIQGDIAGEIYLTSDAETYLVKTGDFEWDAPVVIRVSEDTETGKILVDSALSTDAAKFTVKMNGDTGVAPAFDSGNLICTVYSYTIVDAETGTTKTFTAKTIDPDETIIDFATLTAEGDFAGESDTCFIGFAEVTDYGEAAASLDALYRAGGSATAADLDGKTLYATWIELKTAPGASIKLAGAGSGIRFVTLIDTVTMAKIGMPNLTESEYSAGTTPGVRIGLYITKDYGGSGTTKSYYMDGGKAYDEPWYGDEQYDAVADDRGDKHAFSFGLQLSETQYEYEFTPRAFFDVVYTGGDRVERSEDTPTDETRNPGEPVQRSARWVAQQYAAYLADDGQNDEYDHDYLGLLAAQMNKLCEISGLTFDKANKTFS